MLNCSNQKKNMYPMPNLMPKDLMMKEFGYARGEDIQVLASLKILGLHGALDPTAPVDKPSEMPFETLEQLDEYGASLPWTFTADHQHTGIRKDLRLEDADRAVGVMKMAVDRMDDVPALFAKYQQQMDELKDNPPWAGEDVWSL